MQLQRRLTGCAQLADVGDLGQPPGGGLIEMLQRREGAAVEQAGLDIRRRAVPPSPWSGAAAAGRPSAGSRSGWQRPGTAGCRSARRPRSR